MSRTDHAFTVLSLLLVAALGVTAVAAWGASVGERVAGPVPVLVVCAGSGVCAGLLAGMVAVAYAGER